MFIVRSICERLPNLLYLDLTRCDSVTDVGLNYISKTNLRYLNLSFLTRGSFFALMIFFNLFLTSSFIVGDEGLCEIGQMKSLLSLNLYDCGLRETQRPHYKSTRGLGRNITDKFLRSLIRGAFSLYSFLFFLFSFFFFLFSFFFFLFFLNP